MEYLKPIEALQTSVKHYQKMVAALTVLLGISIFAVPALFKSGPYFVKQQDSYFAVSKLEPWRITIDRIDGFTKLYLSNRYEWSAETFADKEKKLKAITSDVVFRKFKDLLSENHLIAQNQNGKSYYVFEGFSFSNREQKIEAKITKVLRIRNIAIATPVIVRLSYQQAGVSEMNPYGIVLNGIEEGKVPEQEEKAGRS